MLEVVRRDATGVAILALSGQLVGGASGAKRIDTIATALHGRLRVTERQTADPCHDTGGQLDGRQRCH